MFKTQYRANCKAALLFIYQNARSVTFNTLANSETPFNIRFNNHTKDVNNPNAIPACKHFNRHDHDFNNRGKIIIIEQLRHIRTISAKTLAPHGQNQNLNWIHFMQIPFTFIIFYFYMGSKLTDVNRKMTSNILQHL